MDALRAFEALARWEHPSLGPIGPRQFIPIAEESGLIVEVGARVLGTACRVAATANARRPPGMPIEVSVNVAAAQLVDPGFLATVRQALARSGLAPEQLNLEVTEDALVRYPDAARTCLGQLRQLGVGVSIDDFGTGRSSLGCLHHFPIDTVKIDQSLFEPGEDGELAPIVRGLLELTTTMGLTAVAEGIESEEQVERLVRGRLPARPGPRLRAGARARVRHRLRRLAGARRPALTEAAACRLSGPSSQQDPAFGDHALREQFRSRATQVTVRLQSDVAALGAAAASERARRTGGCVAGHAPDGIGQWLPQWPRKVGRGLRRPIDASWRHRVRANALDATSRSATRTSLVIAAHPADEVLGCGGRDRPQAGRRHRRRRRGRDRRAPPRHQSGAATERAGGSSS